MNRRRALMTVAGIAGTSLAARLRAQPAQSAWPARPVRLIVPFAPGGSTDVLGRKVAARLSETLGQNFVVENKAGSAGLVGCTYVANAAPDGYTLLLGTTGTHAINPTSMAKPAYDAVKDFAPVALIGVQPMSLAVHPGVPARNLAELIALLRANPGKYSYASAGNGGIAHLAFEYLKSLAGGIEATHVPYKGGAPALQDVVAGHVPILSDTFSSTLPYHRQGQLRVLAMTGAKRSKVAADIPAAAETVPGMAAATSGIVLAPARTPPEVIEILRVAMAKVMKSTVFQADLDALGVEPDFESTPASTTAFISSEIAKWAPVVKSTNTVMN